MTVVVAARAVAPGTPKAIGTLAATLRKRRDAVFIGCSPGLALGSRLSPWQARHHWCSRLCDVSLPSNIPSRRAYSRAGLRGAIHGSASTDERGAADPAAAAQPPLSAHRHRKRRDPLLRL